MTAIPSREAAGHTNYRELADRLGYELLEKRILKQAGLWVRETHQAQGIFQVERFLPVDYILSRTLKFLDLEKIGRRNYLDVQIVPHDLPVVGLPAVFDGFHLLQLSDLHCDLDPRLIDVVLQRLEGLEYDAVVITGDFHNKIGEDFDASLDLMERLVRHLRKPRFGVMGNHDFIEKVAFLEAVGLPILLNEAVAIERAGERFWICGVDDPHYFQTHDLRQARSRVPAGEAAILLSHTPEPYLEAEALGYQAMLCGHTHGGQFCLPGGLPVLKNMSAPWALLSGDWQHGRLHGYTSRGTGGCGVAMRFFCPPEMTVHTLRRASK